MWQEPVVVWISVYPGIWLEGLRITKENHQDSPRQGFISARNYATQRRGAERSAFLSAQAVRHYVLVFHFVFHLAPTKMLHISVTIQSFIFIWHYCNCETVGNVRTSVVTISIMCNQQMYRVYVNLLKPTSHVMHQQFNIQQLYVLPTLYLRVLHLSQNKQRLVPLTV